jgi:peptide-methionine (S)-S-oxide reductase
VVNTINDHEQLMAVAEQVRTVCLKAAREGFLEEAFRELDAARLWDDPIVTEVVEATHFYPAESYHQEYFANNPQQPYCQYVVAPKVAKFREKYRSRLKV